MVAHMKGKHNPMYKHGLCRSKEYKIWARMHDRCERVTNKSYGRYGGRGIKVCARWDRFEDFLADMGRCPKSFSIERKNNDGDYEPSNCSWIPKKDQSENRSTTIWITFAGKTQSLSKWAEQIGLPKSVAHYRHKAGWTPEQIIMTPRHTQIVKRRVSNFVTYQDKTQSLNAWAKELGINYFTLYSRIKRDGLTFEEAICQPIRGH